MQQPPPNPNEQFGGRVPAEITLSCLLVLLITANICVMVKCRVHKNLNSFVIMTCLTVLQCIRMITFIWRLTKDEYSVQTWVWYRVVTDWCNYLLGLIAIVLFVQWH